MKQAVIAFKKKHKKTFVSDHRIMAEIKRPYTTPEQGIVEAAKDNYVRDKGISLSIIQLEETHG
jgi:hypothetical protein